MNTSLESYLNTNNISSFLCVDVGAKDSIEYIEPLASMCNVYAFEPNKLEFEKIKQKYQSNNLKRLSLYCIGLSNRIGQCAFYSTIHPAMSSLLEVDIENYEKHFGAYHKFPLWKRNITIDSTREINVSTLDEYFKNDTLIDYLKIDTQGSELLVLKGAEILLHNKCINVIKLEVSTVALYVNQTLFSDIDIFLRKRGFILIDFITYKNSYTPIFNSKYSHEHHAPCGDAIYVLDEKYLSRENKIKQSVILSYHNYRDYATFLLKKENIHVEQIKLILTLSQKNIKWRVKNAIKNLTPPLLYQLLNGKNGF